MELDIETTFGKKITSGFLYCISCETAFSIDKIRVVKQNGFPFQVCPNCGAGTVTDCRDWAEVKGIKGYPEIPEEGKIYTLY